ncbi:uncharacterized protein BP5553_06134 [Venustampulla echinocandica]|uniref:Homeobox domain-containing protein n=1 Tax=Venustampulla echinocandica TaxID=2656787 RepID=A0A370TMN0_9HELO|nr:uncharacterized protein BP5553_06134 [Venustampulla echinocandica]RDL36782.1 hypothetical protein BP5553_06134 [Venustampulla echinocandica]
MNAATLPPPPSSPSPAMEGRELSNSSHDEEDFDTVGEHNTSSVMGDGPSGDSENRTHSKQRRKRTRPEDQAILEAEFKQNPKPNKAARAVIVEKVTLNEKEVQIWFQNRRQINRRKSRPLLPHEIAAFGIGGMAALSSDPASASCCSSQETEEAGPSSQQEMISSQEDVEGARETEQPAPEIPQVPADTSETKVQEGIACDKQSTIQPMSSASNVESPIMSSSNGNSSISVPETVTTSFSSTPGHMTGKPIDGSFSMPSPQLTRTSTPPTDSAIQPTSCPGRVDHPQQSSPESQQPTPISQIRLSMSLDGKAELTSSEPSPPRSLPPRPSSSEDIIPQKRTRILQRSHSAYPLGLQAAQALALATKPFVPRLATGRSRDARTWEFCCDSDAQDELTTQAENESHGSAVAAISLLRSTSNSVLKPNSNKRNAPSTKYESSKQGKKPKLERAMSSLARLQNPAKSSKPSQSTENNGKNRFLRSPSGDSDKENWIPHENGGNPRRRPLPSARADNRTSSRAILGDNLSVLSHAVNFGGPSKHKQKKGKDAGPDLFEDQENGEDAGEDVEKFMRGEISPSKKGDLDCVQGLLSLSQGNWR